MIIDTNALSAWRDADVNLLRAMAPTPLLVLPVIAIGEFRYGITRSTQRSLANAWLDQIIRTVRVVAITLDTSRAYAQVRSALDRKGTPIPANDTWIAALALQHGLAVLSRDTHFDVVEGLTRISW